MNRDLAVDSPLRSQETMRETPSVMESRFHRSRKTKERLFRVFCFISALLGVGILVVLLFHILTTGFKWINWDFITGFPSRFASKAGILPALTGTLWIMVLTCITAIPFGVGTAIYLEEYSRKGRFEKTLEVLIANLAGVPSIIYGLLGLTVFVRFFGLGRSLWAGGLTLGLLISPVIIVASREAIRAVPASIRHAAFAVGATKTQTVFSHVIVASLPGIMTGIILSLSRAIGETAPLVVVGALSYVTFLPTGPMDQYSALPIQIFNWASRPQAEFHELAAAAITLLLCVLFLMNGLAVWVRKRGEKWRKW